MRKSKLILPLLMLIIFIVSPIGDLKALAWTGGLLSNKLPTSTNGVVGGNLSVLTDNNSSSSNAVSFRKGNGEAFAIYQLPSPTKIEKILLSVDAPAAFTISFLGSSGNVLSSMIFESISGRPWDSNSYAISPISDVYAVKLSLNSNAYWSATYSAVEFDIFGTTPDVTPPANIKDLVVNNITDSGFKVTWSPPADNDLDKYKIYLNETLKDTISKTTTSYSFSELNPDTSYSLRISSIDTFGNESSGEKITVKTNIPPDTTAPANVTNLSASPTYNSVRLSWKNPQDQDFAKVKVYEDGVYKKSVTTTEYPSAFFDNLDPETEYTFKVTSVDYIGNESNGSEITVKTLAAPKVDDIKNLSAVTYYDKVKLSWDLPKNDQFHHVNIYRKVKEDESFLKQIFGLGPTVVYAASPEDDYKPMFETNGTYWTDLTVEPETKYEYKLVSENADGYQSKGVTVDATTKKEPSPKLEDVKGEENPEGDYVVSWSEPTTGTVKILVGGSVYKTVFADQRSYTIPKGDLKYTVLGDPDVALQPVAKFGTEGDKVQVQKADVNVPFTIKDLIESSNGLLFLISPFVLLSLAFLLVPKFRRIIVTAFKGKDRTEQNISNARRTQKEKDLVGSEQKDLNVRIDKEQKEPRIIRTNEEKEPRTERIERELRPIKEPRRGRQPSKGSESRQPREPRRLKRQPRPKRETRQPREPRERKRG